MDPTTPMEQVRPLRRPAAVPGLGVGPEPHGPQPDPPRDEPEAPLPDSEPSERSTMPNPLHETLDSLWSSEAPSLRPRSVQSLGAAPGFRPARSPAEARAEETTRVARELIDAAADARRLKIAQLRDARLQKEADEKALAPPPAPKKKRAPRG